MKQIRLFMCLAVGLIIVLVSSCDNNTGSGGAIKAKQDTLGSPCTGRGICTIRATTENLAGSVPVVFSFGAASVSVSVVFGVSRTAAPPTGTTANSQPVIMQFDINRLNEVNPEAANAFRSGSYIFEFDFLFSDPVNRALFEPLSLPANAVIRAGSSGAISISPENMVTDRITIENDVSFRR